jgi:outer membrane protein TolC
MVLLALGASSVAAGVSEVTVGEAVRLGLTSGPLAGAPEAARRAAEGEARAYAATEADPELQVQSFLQERSVQLVVPIEAPPATLARARSARLLTDAAEVRAQAARAALGVEIAGMVVAVAEASGVAALMAESEGLARRARDRARALAESGEGERVDAAVLQAEAAGALQRALAAERDRRLAAMRLEQHLGLPIVGSITVPEWPQVPAAPRIDPALLPELVAAELDARAAIDAEAAARLARLPTLAVGLGPGWDYETVGLAGTLNLSLPLYAPSRGAREVAGAEASLAEQRRALLSAESVALAYGAESARDQAVAVEAAYAEVPLDGAMAALTLAYTLGELDLGQYLTRRDAVLSAQRAALSARAQRALTELALWELAGQLPPEWTP